MRIPLAAELDSRDGTSNRDERLTNCLKETTKRGDMAVVRPGLSLDATASGVGNGLVVFSNELVSVYGATLGIGVEPSTDITDLGSPQTGLLNGVMANSGILILCTNGAGPTVKTSQDGITFATVNTTNSLYRPFYALGYFFAFDATLTDLYRSSDSGVTWTLVESLPAYSWTASEVKSGVISLFAPSYSGASYRISSSDYGMTWGSPVAIADFTTLGLSGQATYMSSTGLSFLPCYGDLPGSLISSSDSFSTYSVVRSIPVFTTGDYPNTAYVDGKLYLVEWDAGLDVSLYESTDGVTFDSGTLLYTDSTEIYGVGCFDLNGALHVVYYSDDSPDTLLSFSYNGTIPALATITDDYFDFAQSPL